MNSSTVEAVLMVTNGLASLVSAGFCIAGMIRPGLALPQGMTVNGGTHLYANAYGARAIPLAAVTLALFVLGDRSTVAPVLAIAGLAQTGDCAIGVQLRNKGMAVCAGLLGVLHLASAWWFRTH
ncbi:hypothetical protein FB563_2615 [Streptomyces puniciscabiei]|uniref:DUF4267 domain-containing protein n=1 Tax=Streptomyces puniciscabiei TaxID=164348 RepID=A0A542UEY4_9ACTN|nr:hypothetical protein [Streptomyces puniciscabiei]TQK97638.1 hypothetical protein FB563_2615 [Streptomyces puniciscabiei]